MVSVKIKKYIKPVSIGILIAVFIFSCILCLLSIVLLLSRAMLPEEVALRQEIVTIAQQYLGCNEADGSHEKIIDLYNTQESLPRGYPVQDTDSWCATFVSAVAMQSAMEEWIPTECSCQEMIALMKKNDDWKESDWYIPQKGDIIFYAWGEIPFGECSGWADHVGIVVGVYGPIIKVIEGNKDDSVSYRYVWIGHPQIRGYGLPNYRKAGNCGITPISE